MVEAYMKQSALAHLGLNARPEPDGPTGVMMDEAPFFGQIGIRLDAEDNTILTAAQKALGIDLPLKPNTVSTYGNKTALWLGPNEWLVTLPVNDTKQQLDDLTAALEDHHSAVFDVSDSRDIITLSGDNARDVLKKGCGLDLHPRAFGPGQCAQSTLALAHVLFHQTAEDKKTKAASYRLFVHRSFTEYMWAWLEDAAGEYGIKVG